MKGAAANPLRCTKSVPTVIARIPAATHNSPSPRLFNRNGGSGIRPAYEQSGDADIEQLRCTARHQPQPGQHTPANNANPRLRVCTSVRRRFSIKGLPPVKGNMRSVFSASVPFSAS